MRFFNLLRRVNRGIILAIVLIIGLTCYLIIDGIAFREEREVIKQTLENYAKDAGAFHLYPEQYREIGTSVPDPVVLNKLKEINTLLNKYFTNTNNNHYNLSLKQSVSDEFRYMLERNQETKNTIKSYDAKLTKIKSITKHGANLVTLEAVVNLTTTATPSAAMIHLFFNNGYSYNVPSSDEPPEDLSFSSQSCEITFTCEMVKQNGVWMFSDIENMSTLFR